MEDSKLASLKKLREEYSKTIPSKLQELQQLIDEMRVTIHEKTLEAFKLKIHTISGNAGTFGYTNASIISEEFDERLSDKLDAMKISGANPSWIDEFDAFLERLRQAFNSNH